jgi:hypothetical protein
MPNIPQNQHFIFSSLELISTDFLEADPSHMPLKQQNYYLVSSSMALVFRDSLLP